MNAAFRNAAEGSLAGIVRYADEPLVSTDIVALALLLRLRQRS